MKGARCLAALVSLAWTALTISAALAQAPQDGAANPEEDRSHGLKVSARLLPAANNQPPRLSISAEIPAGWHIYSTTQKPGGPKKTVIQLPESKQYKLAAVLAPSPAPTVEREKYKDVWPDLAIEEHTGQVTWTAPLELAAGTDLSTLAIEGQFKAFLCSDLCVNVTLPFVAKVAPPAMGGMALLRAQVLMAAPVVQSTAAIEPPVKEPASTEPAKPVPQPPTPNAPVLSTEQIKITGSLDHIAVAPGASATLTLTLAPTKGWHVYPTPDVYLNSTGEPTLVVVTDRDGLEVGPAKASGSLKSHRVAGKTQKYYRGDLQISLPVLVPPGATPGTHTLYGLIGYHTCLDTGFCAMPTGARFSVPVTVAATSQAGQTPVQFVGYNYYAAKQAANLGTSVAPVEQRPAPAPVAADESMIAVVPYGGSGHTGLLINLGLAFVGGLLLNAMPCVLPVIGLKVMSFVQQAGQDRRQVFMLNLWFSLGVMSVFLVWATLIGVFSSTASSWYQKPEFSITLAAVTFAFALSLLGVWEIPLPGFVGSGATYQVGERAGATGAVAKGVLSTILATPCVGPLIGATVDWTLNTGSVAMVFAIYGAMGLGMAFPYLVLGANPAWLRWLPKPGLWMDTFKQLMGFLLLATVVWIFSFMPPEYFLAALALIFGVWLACWWIGRTPLTAELGSKLQAWAVAAVVILAVAVPSFRWLVREPGEAGAAEQLADSAVWQQYSPERLAELQSQGKTVLIDFTASWCLNCKLNKGISLRKDAIEQYMEEHGIVGLVADKTLETPEIDLLMKRLHHPSGLIPFYAVFPGAGGPVITYKDPLLFEGTLRDMLEKAGPSRMEAPTSGGPAPVALLPGPVTVAK